MENLQSFGKKSRLKLPKIMTEEKQDRQIINKAPKRIASMLFATGIFAVLGALYRWGDGSLFAAPRGTDLKLFYGDLIFAGPLSIIASIGFWKLKKWGALTAIVASGVYIYGSLLVYVSVVQNGLPYPLQLVLPPIFGLGLSVYIIWWTWGNLCQFCK